MIRAAPFDFSFLPPATLGFLRGQYRLAGARIEHGRYQIQDEGFVEWLRQLELEEQWAAGSKTPRQP